MSNLNNNSKIVTHKDIRIWSNCINLSNQITETFFRLLPFSDKSSILHLGIQLYNWIALLLFFINRYKTERGKKFLLFIVRHYYYEIFPLKNTILHDYWIKLLTDYPNDMIDLTNKESYIFMLNSSSKTPYNGLSPDNLFLMENSKKFTYDGNIVLIEYRGLIKEFQKYYGRSGGGISLSEIHNLKNLNLN
jgi:hypothetical protein